MNPISYLPIPLRKRRIISIIVWMAFIFLIAPSRATIPDAPPVPSPAPKQPPLTEDEVEGWLKDHRPSWWNYAQPHSVEEETALAGAKPFPPKKGSRAEIIKAAFLASEASTLSPAEQRIAAASGFQKLFDDKSTMDEAKQFAISVFNDPGLPFVFKQDFLRDILYSYCENEQSTDLSWMISQAKWAPRDLARIKRAQDVVYRTEPSEVYLRGINALQDENRDFFQLYICEFTISRLLSLGDIEGAQSLFDKLSNLYPGRTLELQKSQQEIIDANNIYPESKELRDIVLKTIPPESIQKPAGFDNRLNLMYPLSLGDLSEEDAAQFRLHQIKINKVPLSFLFWSQFMADGKHVPGGYELNFKLIKSIIDSKQSDYEKARVIDELPYTISMIETEQTDPVDKLLTSEIDPGTLPQSAEAFRLWKTLVMLAQGKPIDGDIDLASYKDKGRFNIAFYTKMILLLRKDDESGLRSTLDQAPDTESLNILIPCLKAEELLHMTEKAESLRGALKKELYNYILRYWELGRQSDLVYISDIIQTLGTSTDIPTEFSQFVDAQTAHRIHFLQYRIVKAFVDKDWQTCVNLAQDYEQKSPGSYGMSWVLGASLAQLGKHDEAIEALNDYVDHELSSIYLADAKNLLDKLKQAPK